MIKESLQKKIKLLLAIIFALGLFFLIFLLLQLFLAPRSKSSSPTSINENQMNQNLNRSVGKILAVEDRLITISTPSGRQEEYFVDEKTGVFTYMTVEVTPDEGGFRPQEKRSLTLSSLRVGQQVEIDWVIGNQGEKAINIIIL